MTESEVAPCLFMVFGATGNLMQRKLLPALYRLVRQAKLGSRFKVMGISRSAMDDQDFRVMARRGLETQALDSSERIGSWCEQYLHYSRLDRWTSQGFQALENRIRDFEIQWGLPGNRVFYLALPPEPFPAAISGMGKPGLNRSQGWIRLVIEKPFGRDLASAQELNAVAHRYFPEGDIYR